MYIRKRTLLCIKVPNRGRRGDFFLSFFFYLSRVQKRSRYGEAVTGTGNNALYRKQNYDRGSPKEEQFLNGVHLKSLISRYKACVKYKTVAVFLCIIVWCNKSKVLKTFRWASNASSSFCCSMHLPEETIDGAVAAKSTTIKSQELELELPDQPALLEVVIFIKWTNFFMTLLFQFSAPQPLVGLCNAPKSRQ